MKRYNNIFLAALFGATLLLGGCREEEKIADDLYIPGLGGEEYAENELDKWLYQNYTLPYNIDVVYRWDAAQTYSSLSEVQLVPVEFDAVQPMMAALRDVWFEPYIQATGNSQDFLKEVAPKKIVLVGSPEYQNGSYKLGQAEGGRKILLLNVNNFDASDENELKESLHTIVHEFTHILHQTKLFDKKYQEISTGRYNSNWTLLKDPEARRLGFITSYAMLNKDEDFAEMVSGILVFGYDWFKDTVLAEAEKSTENPNTKADLEAKLAIVESYFKETWNIEFFDNETSGEKGLETYFREAIEKVVSNPPTK